MGSKNTSTSTEPKENNSLRAEKEKFLDFKEIVCIIIFNL